MKFPQLLRRRSAIALIVTLAMLSLMVVLVVSLMTLSGGELRMASQASSAQTARSLAEMSVNLVVSQLRNAMSGDEAASGAETWASQPGLIRQYTAQNGAFNRGYRLYSHNTMVYSPAVKTRDGDQPLANDSPPSDWDLLPDRYADLNRPAVKTTSAGTSLKFPVVDPRSTAEGFSYAAQNMAGITLNGVVTSGDALKRRLPMPVEWMYVLRDGSLGTLDASSRFIGDTQPTSDNPIVGRIAFWGDDLSGKINLNTASEPTAWDVPRFVSKETLGYANSQPANKEFQRYPGGPATTALSPVLYPGISADNMTPARKEGIYAVLPRVANGGSKSGAVTVLSGGTTAVVPKSERLLASPDEWLPAR